jgi:23S rRNA pseudouridine1911/1915/1917 synthase
MRRYAVGVTQCNRKLSVLAADTGRRLDLFLAEKLALSRAQVRRLLANGAVSVDGRVVGETDKGARLVSGAGVEVAPFARRDEQRVRPEPQAPLAVLAAGPGWLAVDKPAGTPVHPLREDETGTLLGAVIARHPELHGVGEGGLRSGVVHRLDVDTSGVLLVATRGDAWERLRRAFAEHRVEKVYRAIVVGRVVDSETVELPLVMARHRPARVRVAEPGERARGARVGRLSYRPLEALGPATLLEVRPRTGFLHQIRATLAYLGFPVAGDRSYGPAHDPTGAARHMLHAAQVAFEEIRAASPDAADFADLLKRLASPLSAAGAQRAAGERSSSS